MNRIDRRGLLQAGLALGAAPALARAAQDPPAPAQERPFDSAAEDLRGIGKTPHTKFAVNVEMWWSNLPFLERVKKAAALGFPGIEFWDWRSKDLDALAKLTSELGLAVTQFTGWGFEPGLCNAKHHDEFEAAIRAALEVSKKLGNQHLCVVAGNLQPGRTLAEMHADVITGLKRVAPLAEQAGVTLMLEPMNGRVDHPGHCLYGSADALAIVRAVGSPKVKILWDLYHMQISEGDLCGHLREGYDEITYLQIADHPGRHEPGTGEIHYARVLREAHELGFRGWVGLECSPKGDPLDAARAVAQADRW
ncbi:MAG: TIM barrel protein [Planctomycetes bacterium]|nr:TIM barrel protein [Planctomycetota bacterium]